MIYRANMQCQCKYHSQNRRVDHGSPRLAARQLTTALPVKQFSESEDQRTLFHLTTLILLMGDPAVFGTSANHQKFPFISAGATGRTQMSKRIRFKLMVSSQSHRDHFNANHYPFRMLRGKGCSSPLWTDVYTLYHDTHFILLALQYSLFEVQIYLHVKQ